MYLSGLVLTGSMCCQPIQTRAKPAPICWAEATDVLFIVEKSRPKRGSVAVSLGLAALFGLVSALLLGLGAALTPALGARLTSNASAVSNISRTEPRRAVRLGAIGTSISRAIILPL